MSNYEDMNKEELQEALAARDLPTSGNKDDLVARLELADAEAEGADTSDAPVEDEGEGGADARGHQPAVQPQQVRKRPKPEQDAEVEGEDEQIEEATFGVSPVTSAAAVAQRREKAKAERTERRDPHDKANRFTSPGFDPVEENEDPREELGELLELPEDHEGRVEQAFEDVEELEPREIDDSQFGHLPPQHRPSAHNPDGVGGYEIMPDGRRRKLVRAGATEAEAGADGSDEG